MRRFKKDKHKIVKLDQDSGEWLDWRNGGIGSSDVALLMSPEPVFDRTVRSLWEQRVGYERAVELDNEHIRRGKELEPIIRDKVNAILDSFFEPQCVERIDSPYLRASLDGYNPELKAILEIKSPAEKTFNSYLNSWEIPKNYLLQMQYQMLVCNASIGYFSFYNKDIMNDVHKQKHDHPYIMLVEPDFNLQLEIEKRCAMFWYAVQNKIPIGWKNGELTLFPATIKKLILIVTEKQAEKIRKINLPVDVYINACSYGSEIILCTDISMLANINEGRSTEERAKILSLVESPFCNEPYPLKLTKKAIMEEFNSV